METTSCVKAVIMAAQQYRNNPSDCNVVNLQRQLDVLISISCKQSALKFFNPKELLPTECFSALVEIMSDPHVNTTLAQKTMCLLSNLSQDNNIRETLHVVFHLTSGLASYLRIRGSSPADVSTVQCLELLQKLTYNQKVSYQENFIEDLVRYLVKSIVSKENSIVQSCLGLLANLCRHNFSIQTYVKNLENMKSVYKTLISYLSHHNMTMVVFSLSILTSLCLYEELGEKLFNHKNVHQTFQLIFNIILNGDSGTSRSYAVDLFVDLIKNPKIQNSLVAYDHLQLCVKQVIDLLSSSSDTESVTKLYELLLSFCSVNGLRCVICRTLMDSKVLTDAAQYRKHLSGSQLTEPFFAIVHWAEQSVETHDLAPLHALDFLREMYEEMLDSDLASNISPRNDLVLPVINKTLAMKMENDGMLVKKKCQKIIKAIRLLSVMCEDDQLKSQLSKSVNLATCFQILEHQFSHNKIGSIYRQSVSGDVTDEWSQDGVDVVLYLLDLMLKLRKSVQGMNEQFVNVLQDPRLVPFLCYGMTSDSRQRVYIVMKLVAGGFRLEGFPSLVLGDAIAATNSKKNAQSQELKELNTDSPPSPKCKPPSNIQLSDKENIPTTKRGSKGMKKECPSDMEVSVQNIIDKMQSGMELNDVRVSEIIDVYEHKLQSFQTKENHLQDLLEAKALALSQADRLISQYRCRRAQSEAEAHKLRLLVQDSEKRCEELVEQKNEVMLDRERQQSEIEHFIQEKQRLDIIAEEYRELTTTFAEQTQRLENTQRQLATLKQEHQTMSEMHEMLRRHNETLKQQHDVASQQLNELEEERKNLSRAIKEKETKIQELTKSHLKQSESLKKYEQECNQMEEAIDKLRRDLAKTEQTKKDLTHQVSSLEVVCRQHESDIKEKDALLRVQKTEIDKHAQIAALINELSSGKVAPTEVNM